MAFPKEMLNPGEELILDLRPHWWYITPAAAALAGSVILGLLALAYDWPDAAKFLTGILVLIGLGFFISRYVRWTSINFVVTSERLISRSGVIAKKGLEIPLERINTVHFSQGLFERLVGSGDLGIESAGEGGQQQFHNVRQPKKVQQEIYRAKDMEEKDRYRAMGNAARSGPDGMGVAAAPGHSIPEQIAKLDELRVKGTLTEEEFQAKKNELLDRM